MKIIPVILCGGSGTRLWPLSREAMPKQFLSLLNEHSLLQNTVLRAQRASGAENGDFVFVTLSDTCDTLSTQLQELGEGLNTHILCEPVARNTAAAVALASAYINHHFGSDTMMWVLPSDHHIADEKALKDALNHTIDTAKQGYLSTFGIRPTRPDTGYGYILYKDGIEGVEGAHHVQEFVEKPNLETAQSYLDHGHYLWNSGMFVFQTATILDNFSRYAPEIMSAIAAMDLNDGRMISEESYAQIQSHPFDTQVMEKADKVAVIPCDIGWSDIGSWESIWEISDKNPHGNVVEGQGVLCDSENCFVYAADRLVAVAGLNDIVVIETGDSVLISHKSKSDSLKKLVGALKKDQRREVRIPAMQKYEWGSMRLLSQADGYVLHEIIVNPGCVTPHVIHKTTKKSWTVVEGEGAAVFGAEHNVIRSGYTRNIDIETPHYVRNLGKDSLKILQTRYSKEMDYNKDVIILQQVQQNRGVA